MARGRESIWLLRFAGFDEIGPNIQYQKALKKFLLFTEGIILTTSCMSPDVLAVIRVILMGLLLFRSPFCLYVCGQANRPGHLKNNSVVCKCRRVVMYVYRV